MTELFCESTILLVLNFIKYDAPAFRLKGEYDLGIGGISLYFAGMDTKSYRNNNFSADTHWDEYIAETASISQKVFKKN